MAENTLDVRIKQRYDTEANWSSSNPVLLKGEMAITSDSGKNGIFKIGDGVSTWSALSYTDLLTYIPNNAILDGTTLKFQRINGNETINLFSIDLSSLSSGSSSGSDSEDTNIKTPKKLSGKTAPTTIYNSGDAFNPAGIEATVTYTDDTTKVLSENDLTFVWNDYYAGSLTNMVGNTTSNSSKNEGYIVVKYTENDVTVEYSIHIDINTDNTSANISYENGSILTDQETSYGSEGDVVDIGHNSITVKYANVSEKNTVTANVISNDGVKIVRSAFYTNNIFMSSSRTGYWTDPKSAITVSVPSGATEFKVTVCVPTDSSFDIENAYTSGKLLVGFSTT